MTQCLMSECKTPTFTMQKLTELSLFPTNDYRLWTFLYRWLPQGFVERLFVVYTFIQLYWLGVKYLLVELHRYLSTSVRILTPNDPDIPNDLQDYIAIVTGGTQGIGLCVARDFVRRGCTVVVTAFDLTPTEQDKVIKLIQDDHQRGSIHVFDIDLRDISSVCSFVNRFYSKFDRLDILVNNAAVMYVPQNYTKDGFEYHYQINYLSHTLLIWLLMPALNRAGKKKPARIVNVSSSTHFARDLFLDDLQVRSSPYSRFHSYAQSKLCVLMNTYFLANWLSKEPNNQQYHILVNAIHPGVVNTPLYQNVWIVRRYPLIGRLLFRSVEEGAETVIYAALSSEVETSGNYYEDCRSIRSSRFSYRKTMQTRLASITAEQLNPIIERFNRQRSPQQPFIPVMYT